jgi:hypothetical protein
LIKVGWEVKNFVRARAKASDVELIKVLKVQRESIESNLDYLRQMHGIYTAVAWMIMYAADDKLLAPESEVSETMDNIDESFPGEVSVGGFSKEQIAFLPEPMRITIYRMAVEERDRLQALKDFTKKTKLKREQTDILRGAIEWRADLLYALMAADQSLDKVWQISRLPNPLPNQDVAWVPKSDHENRLNRGSSNALTLKTSYLIGRSLFWIYRSNVAKQDMLTDLFLAPTILFWDLPLHTIRLWLGWEQPGTNTPEKGYALLIWAEAIVLTVGFGLLTHTPITSWWILPIFVGSYQFVHFLYHLSNRLVSTKTQAGNPVPELTFEGVATAHGSTDGGSNEVDAYANFI